VRVLVSDFSFIGFIKSCYAIYNVVAPIRVNTIDVNRKEDEIIGKESNIRHNSDAAVN